MPQFLNLPGGRLAYDDTGGDGPLVVALPGLGDLRQSYRFLTPPLVEAGYRVVTADLRGMGESSVGWDDYSSMVIGDDLVALIRHLDAGPVIAIGNSHGGGAATWAAATQPDTVRALVLLDAFVADPEMNAAMGLVLRAALAGPWGAATWMALFGHEFKHRPPDYDAFRKTLGRNVREPGRMDSVRGMFFASKAPVAARLGDVRAPSLVVMGAQDPDFPNPTAEANRVAEVLGSRAVLIENAGHYPHVEQPAAVAAAVVPFLNGLP